MLRTIPSVVLALATLVATAAPNDAAPPNAPSRPAVEGCTWHHLADAKVGLAAWVQDCDFGDRKVNLFLRPGGLAMRYSDGGATETLVEVFDLLPGETIKTGLQRIYAAHTAPALVKRCVLTPYEETTPVAGVQRFSFEPDPTYRKQLAAQADPNEVGDPPCGDMGSTSDGIQYFEARPAAKARKLLFVRVGQDEPLFDEQSLEPIDSVPIASATAADAAVDDGCCNYRTGPGGVGADFLLETCSVTGRTAHGMIPYFDCQSYVLAVLDSYKALQDVLPRERRLCLPPDLTVRAILRTMAKHYVYERDARRRAAEVVLEALRPPYACARTSDKPA